MGGSGDQMALYQQQRIDQLADMERQDAKWAKQNETARADMVTQKKEDEARAARLGARKKKEERERITNLSAAEGAAVDEAEDIAADLTSDRDSQFGTMFAALLKGAQSGLAGLSNKKGVTRSTGLRQAPKSTSRTY